MEYLYHQFVKPNIKNFYNPSLIERRACDLTSLGEEAATLPGVSASLTRAGSSHGQVLGGT